MTKINYPGTVLDRLNRKIEVLRERAQLVTRPPETYVPKSLREFARWRDDELGIYPIASPNEISTTHPRYGEAAKAVQELIVEICSRTKGRRRRATLRERCASLQCELETSKRNERALIGQFHVMQDRIDQLKKQLASASAKQEYLSDQNSLLTRQLRELKSIAVINLAAHRSE